MQLLPLEQSPRLILSPSESDRTQERRKIMRYIVMSEGCFTDIQTKDICFFSFKSY